jgi:leucyl aminopeptidase
MRQGNLVTRPAGAIAIGIFQNQRTLGGAAAAVDRATRGAITSLLRARDFSGRFLESAVLYPSGLAARRLIVIGLGPEKEFSEPRACHVAAAAARRARSLGAGTLATVAHGAGRGGLDPERAAQAVAEGSILGSYRYSAYLSDPGSRPLKRVEIVERDAAAAKTMKDAAARGARWASAACIARDLASTPGQDLTPERLGERAIEIAKTSGATARVLKGAQLERLGMGALIAVGRGSVNPPVFIVLEREAGGARNGKSARPTIVVIGKGVTFDTGGISIKPRENMHKMKYDMSGAAAVLGLFAALPSLELPFRVVGLVPSAENMPGGRAVKPGDVVRALDGTTIEITNTDAEGRLLLADALGYARRYDPEVVLDLATLTGAISIALGNRAAGLFTEDHLLASELLLAGEATGERLWPMPLWDEYAAEMKGETADLWNSSGAKEGGAILGAVFLKHFARGMRWAHLDIASTAWSPREHGHVPKGPTGFGVRLLLEWLSRRGGAASAPASASSAGRARPASRTRAARA